MKILLLQGPVGPFFADLHAEFEAQNFHVTRVAFHRADAFFAPRNDVVHFQGNLENWETWLEEKLGNGAFDRVVYFGCMRPAHMIAEAVARRHGVQTFSLEEGYIRSGYVCCEAGGNNLKSPIYGKVPETTDIHPTDTPQPFKAAFWSMCVWGTLYYLLRSLTKAEQETVFYHRITRAPLQEAFSWVNNSLRILRSRIFEYKTRRDLMTKQAKKYILIPMQVPSDSQIQYAANGWTMDQVVISVLTGLTGAQQDLHAVFKMHPLDTTRHRRRQFIQQTANAMGLADRVHILESGSIGELSKQSDGVALINSTSGFSAIYHGVPLLVLGKAIFRNPDLVTCGETDACIAHFLRDRSVSSADTRMAYLQYVTDEALVRGDFYAKSGRLIAASEIIKKCLDPASIQISITQSKDDVFPSFADPITSKIAVNNR